MSNFWPSGINLNDSSSPLQILQLADNDWKQQSKGLLALLIQDSESSSKSRVLTIHAKHVPSNRTATLFSVIHRPNAPYPVVIEPISDRLPDYLKKSVYKPGIEEIALGGSLGRFQGRTETNEWVCDTPSEFRTKLEKVFNLGVTKASLVSLISGEVTEKEE